MGALITIIMDPCNHAPIPPQGGREPSGHGRDTADTCSSRINCTMVMDPLSLAAWLSGRAYAYEKANRQGYQPHLTIDDPKEVLSMEPA